MFYFARAATLPAQGALTPDGQKTAMTYVQKQYKNFHGSDEGFNDLVAAAKANPNPPAGFTIKNANEIAQAQAANEEEYNKTHPSETLWKNLKMALTGARWRELLHDGEGHRSADAEGQSDQAGAGDKAEDHRAGDGRQHE